ncbi:PQQ-dependent sugar dehydrogenase [Pontibacter akesuensis]|uniref:Glucose/arabinose dehydrogenase, beta-propeller fold n=1 Tax=Pontibacter akesuensis TaxID=388950 RepID=A0A1I7HQ67_9BACT|nr:PQQ-dependent sugar dehydrogenase [Pontibacter akesuensis]GHA63027.1 oxidoreductase [Pontibacter akesuensis]SFU62862.1 Glucose/arabinose dehydrogenase, beta-propeller fold [Pontibacter akesuensis]
MKTKTTLLALSMALLCSGAWAQDTKPPITASYQGNIFKPTVVAATDERVRQLKVPAGFTVSKFADNLNKPRMLAVHTDGTVYVTDRDKGTVTMLRDTNNDGKSDQQKVVATKKDMHGIALRNGKAYLMTVNDIFTADIKQDGTLGELKQLATGFPEAGQHADRTLEFGPDGMLYIQVGSTCNACEETHEENATLVQMKQDGSSRRVYARGLRNFIGFDWHPQTKELWGFDHGIDWLGDETQKEELNKIVDGGNYGWPYVFENGKPNLADEPPKGMSWEEYAKQTKFPAMLYDAHSAPMDFLFYTKSQFPADYRGDAFLTLHGSWNRSEPAGYKVVRVRFENGQPTKIDDFMTGFLVNNNKAVFGRVVGLAMHNDGSLLIADDANGVIYRVAHKGK